MSKLSRQLPPLSTLVVFEAAFRLRSFSRAANECALSQASVSRQMRQLEDNLGIRLFNRQRHNVAPTEEGIKLAVTVQSALRELATTATELRETASANHTFTIYSDMSIASNIVSPLIGRLQQLHPDIQFRILSSYEPIDQTQTPFDIGFQVGRIGEDLFDVKSVANDLVFPVCSPSFAAGLPPDLTIEDLAKLPLLHMGVEDKDWPDWHDFLQTFTPDSTKTDTRLVFSSYQICLDVAERGEGVALGWARSVSRQMAEGKLVRLTEEMVEKPDGVCVYFKKDKSPTPIAQSIMDTICASIEPLDSATF